MLRLNWGAPCKADVALTWRYFKAVDLEDGATSAVASDRRLPATSYFDLAASYPVTKQISVMAGINNLFDKDPPITSKYGVGQGNGNTFPSTYDALGRKLFMNLTARF